MLLKMRILPIIFLFTISFCPVVSAQDFQFSQYLISPQMYNPATTGLYNGNFRVSAIYRDQWYKPLENPFTTFGASVDLRFQLEKRKRYNDAFGGGIYFTGDRAGLLNVSNNQICIQGAYHKAMDPKNTSYLSVGFSASMNQRNVNYENITFQDQFDGLNSFNLNTAENLPLNNYSYPDMNIGLNYVYSPKKTTGFFAGLALAHINRPEMSFYKKDGDIQFEAIESSKLKMRFTANAGLNIPISEFSSISPRVLYTMQGNSKLINIGANLRMELDNYNSSYFHLGAFALPVLDAYGFAVEGLGVMAGYEIQNFIVGLSYDFSLRDITRYRSKQGSFELSLSYYGVYDDDEDDMCPKF